MLVDGTVVAVLAGVLAVALFSRRRSHDDEHSVQGYHRQLHTLEHISVHPSDPDEGDQPGEIGKPAYPESAVRLAGTHTVRVTDPSQATGPPAVPPPVVPVAGKPVAFDDAVPVVPPPMVGITGRDSRAINTMNHRPRRLAGPALAVAAVIVLIVILLVTGSHTVAPGHHHAAASSPHHHGSTKPHSSSTTTTAVPVVSSPQAFTAHEATYDVAHSTFTLVLMATSGSCWVDVTNTTTGAILYTHVLAPGQQQTVDASGPVTVVAGAPTALSASVDGTSITLPFGFQTPFTMQLVPLAAAT
jgi:hypothetical protein